MAFVPYRPASLKPASAASPRRQSLQPTLPSIRRAAVSLSTSTPALGCGGHASVVRGEHHGQAVAVKLLPVTDAATLTELRAFRAIGAGHPNIIAARPAVASPHGSHYYLPMELADGDLMSAADAAGGLEESAARSIFVGVLRGLSFLHSRSVYHMDVKPENILMCGSVPKLADFGSASLNRMTSQEYGTQIYAACEAVQSWCAITPSPDTCSNGSIASSVSAHSTASGRVPPSPCSQQAQPVTYDASKADAWALGVSLWVLVTGYFPWRVADVRDDRFRAWAAAADRDRACGRVLGVTTSQHGTPLTPEFQSLVAGLLHPEPAARLSIKQAESHAWFAPVMKKCQ